MTTAVVVGSGPNGLAAAVTLASEGIDVRVVEATDTIGGGVRSAELTLPGLIHDECSGFHPLAVDTPFSRRFDLSRHGLTWKWPEIQYAHPLDHGGGAAAWQSVDRTAEALGTDGRRWNALFGSVTRQFEDVVVDFLQPMLHVPRHPMKLAGFGLRALSPAALVSRLLCTDEGRALFAGVAAHAFRPFDKLASSAIGIALGSAAHRYGWPVAEGGSSSIARAMVSILDGFGAKIETGHTVRSLAELSGVDIVMLDVAPRAAVDIVGDAMPQGIARAFRRYKHGPGSFKVEFAIEGGVPWTHEPSRSAGTIHLGGTAAEIVANERDVHRGIMPERPFVLVGQQSVADPSRAIGGVHPLYSYAHVPAGYTGDATEAIESQIERFAPGFRERIVGRHVRSVRAMEDHNANYIGGDVVTGANSAFQLVFRPRPAIDPYKLGLPGVFLCSAATPPGAGAHGMCGYNAALSALSELRR
ncbi:phytoene desaturase family protein [Rhodococcus jostii]|uniref:phytoene desaturase family protein n=1 Tax=Rhodococcus jostii TaxID=132919 RepID=UPI00363C17EB